MSLAWNGAEAPLNILESGSRRRHRPVSGAAVLMTGNGSCVDLLLSNKRSSDARQPLRWGSGDCRLSSGRVSSLAPGILGCRTAAIREPLGAASVSSQPWAASRWEASFSPGSPLPETFLAFQKWLKPLSFGLHSCDPTGYSFLYPSYGLGYSGGFPWKLMFPFQPFVFDVVITTKHVSREQCAHRLNYSPRVSPVC